MKNVQKSVPVFYANVMPLARRDLPHDTKVMTVLQEGETVSVLINGANSSEVSFCFYFYSC